MMEKSITRVKFECPRPIDVLSVAAYARVSSGKDAMLHSLSAQVSYYSDMIQHHPGWQYKGVYAAEAITGTKDAREGFQRLGVDVYFEEQNIHTMSADGELMLTILASYAQEESRSASENQKWRIRKNFESGLPWVGNMLGYRLRDGEYKVIPQEAEVVKRIFSDYLSGMGYLAICKELNEADTLGGSAA